MATGRIYRLRKRRRVNYFTYTEYNDVCKDIKGANPVNNVSRSVLVEVSDGKTNLADFIARVVAQNANRRVGNKDYALSPVSYNNHLGKKNVIRIVYPDHQSAVIAAGIINRMAFPDSIVPENVNTDGSVTTRQGLRVNVDVKEGENGEMLADSGSNYEPGKVDGTTSDPASGVESGPNWYLIGGAVVVGLIVILAIVKLIKKK